MDRLYTTYSERAELTIEEYAYLLSCKAQIEALRATMQEELGSVFGADKVEIFG